MRSGAVATGQSAGVHVPQVHAFNVVRAAFMDKELSTETTAFVERGIRVAMRGFSSPHWEVRLSVSVAFSLSPSPSDPDTRIPTLKYRYLRL